MLIFHGGFTKEQVSKLRMNSYVLYKKSDYDLFRINQKNTFTYYTIDAKSKKKELINNIIEQNYINQWIHCFKYLNNALYFCDENYNYVVVFDIPDDTLEKYIGVGDYKYDGYKIEYRIPRSEINSENIVDVIEVNNLNKILIKYLKEKYSDNLCYYYEHEEGKKILKESKQKCKYI